MPTPPICSLCGDFLVDEAGGVYICRCCGHKWVECKSSVIGGTGEGEEPEPKGFSRYGQIRARETSDLAALHSTTK
jgi:hypothetical protein